MTMLQVVEIRKILTSFGVGCHCLMGSGKLMKLAFSQSLSTSTLEPRMLAEWASQPWTMIRSRDGKGKGLFSWVSFLKWRLLVRQVQQVQWKNEWQEHLREAMTLLKSGYGESLLWPELPQPASTMSARTSTFDISWHTHTYCYTYIIVYYIVVDGFVLFFFRFQAGCPVLGFQSGLWCLRATQTRWWVWEWGTSEEPGRSVMRHDAVWHNLLDITPKMWTAQLERPSQSFWHNVFDFQRMPGLTAISNQVTRV